VGTVARLPSNEMFVGHYEPMAPSEADVRRQLERLLASAVFANAGRMSRFLKFVVEKTLAGEGERLKEYVVGVEVFDRDTSYDPRVDSIVRVEAARLRSKLAEYYAGDGRGDAIVLTLPKGGYAPFIKLEERPAAVNGAATANGSASTATAAIPVEHAHRQPTQRRWMIAALLAAGAATAAVLAWPPSMAPVALRVAVLPFTSGGVGAGSDTFAQQLTEGVTAELVRAGRFSVVASSAARAEHSATRRPRDVATALDADVLIQARVRDDGERVRVETYAVSGEREEKLWVESFAGTVGDPDNLEREIAASIGAALDSLDLVRERRAQ
jgi:TolB-like protein